MNHDTNDYTSDRNGWKQVSKHEPCPVCGKDHWCYVAPDKKAVTCRGVTEAPDGWKKGKPASNGDGFQFYRIESNSPYRNTNIVRRVPKINYPPVPIHNIDFTDIACSRLVKTNNEPKLSGNQKIIVYDYDKSHRVTRIETRDETKEKGYSKKIIPSILSNEGQWINTTGGQSWIPYGLEYFKAIKEQLVEYDKDDIEENHPIVYGYVNVNKLREHCVIGVEGEKCVDAVINAWGLAAFTVQGSQWNEKNLDYAMNYLRENQVKGIIYIPDNDESGQKKADAMFKAANRNQIPFIQLDISKMWLDCPETGDIADWLATEENPQYKFIPLFKEIDRAIDARKVQEKHRKNSSKIALHTDMVKEEWGKRLKFNTLKRAIELDGEPINKDYLRIEIGYEIGIDVSATDACSIVESIAKKNSYSPIVEYLKEVAAKHQDVDTTIIENIGDRYFGTDNPLHNAYIKRTLIAAVARAMKPGCKHDCAAILVGEQGYFKSTFWRRLFGDDWFTDEVGDCSDKDEFMKLHQVWAAEIAEFEVVYRRKDISQLKRFMSAQVDDYRPPYGRQVERYPRASVLVGTSNERQILNDPTGNRRFWIVPVNQRINITQLRSERDLIWASAVKLYTQGEQWWLTDTEEYLQAIDNKNYLASDPWEQIILGHIANESSVTTTDILLNCVKMDASRMDAASQRRVAAILKVNGWISHRTRVNGEKVRYWVRDVGPHGPDTGPHVQMYPAQAKSIDINTFQQSGPDGPDKTLENNLETKNSDSPNSEKINTIYRNLSGPSGPSGPPPNLTTPPRTFNKGDEVRYVGSEKSRATGKKLVVTGTSADGVWVMRPDRFPDGPFNPNDLEPWGG